ncbi:MAG: urate hydroxylase PuuD, partial [Rhodoferax sp.]|nr:urate hydroxylase PuuD [Rhodoferax sp.]
DEDLKRQGVSGELWAVHGGGFYHPVKFAGAPATLPAHLHWFYWESYSTWLTGFALFTVSYLWNAGTYLVDKSRMDWSPNTAVLVALAFLVVFWLLYDAVCRIVGQRKHGDRIVGLLMAVLVCVASYLACQWFAGRAAFLLVGAMIATSMSANVLFWIIPGQRKMVASIKAGEAVDPVHGWRGKQRSVHNTYFTLPVLFAMLSNHYSFTYSHAMNWLVLIVMMGAGAAIRQFFVLRHGFKLGRNPHPWPYVTAGVAAILAVVVWLAPQSGAGNAMNSGAFSADGTRAAATIDYEQLQPVLAQRCYTCHGETVQMKSVRVDSAQGVKQHAQAIYQQTVVSKIMPLTNATGMTDEERELVQKWFESGAKF